MYDNIDVTEDSGIVTITLNRPDKLNAMVGHMRRDLPKLWKKQAVTAMSAW